MQYWLLFLLIAIPPSHAGMVATDVPLSPDVAKTYLIYLHGQIIETSGPHPTDPRFGVYDSVRIVAESDADAKQLAKIEIHSEHPELTLWRTANRAAQTRRTAGRARRQPCIIAGMDGIR